MTLAFITLTLAIMAGIAIVRRAPEPAPSFSALELMLWGEDFDAHETWTMVYEIVACGGDLLAACGMERGGRLARLAGELPRVCAATHRAQKERELDLRIQVAALFARRPAVSAETVEAERRTVREAVRGLSALRFDRFDAFDGELVPFDEAIETKIVERDWLDSEIEFEGGEGARLALAVGW